MVEQLVYLIGSCPVIFLHSIRSVACWYFKSTTDSEDVSPDRMNTAIATKNLVHVTQRDFVRNNNNPKTNKQTNKQKQTTTKRQLNRLTTPSLYLGSEQELRNKCTRRTGLTETTRKNNYNEFTYTSKKQNKQVITTIQLAGTSEGEGNYNG